ncbi:MAG: ZIP family metal transporter [Candidatus Nomurabacteria bacterium]|jgi:zinc and cadmium transporter|nr:ZIP family metal transporter [Candidatus Nomurabacteria bacterium]
MEQNLALVIFFSLVGGVFSLVGGVLLLANKSWGKALARYATPFAAGALLAAAFMDLLPEAIIGSGEPQMIMVYTLIGLLFFFLLESAIHWFHDHNKKGKKLHPVVSMIIIGDTIHNFIDGLAIAAGFLISPASGIVVTLVVAMHEIPHEIGDFGLMLDKGLSRGKVLLVNVLSSLATTVSAVIFYCLGNAHNVSLGPLLGIVAGFFIYIAAAGIIPTLHEEKIKKEVVKKVTCLLVGVVIVSLAIMTFHDLIDENSDGHHHHEEKHFVEEPILPR